MANENLFRLIEQTPDIKSDSKRSIYLFESQPESLIIIFIQNHVEVVGIFQYNNIILEDG